VQVEHVPPATQVIEEHVMSILSSNDSPDLHFDLSVNPYRGCEHGCVYCFARPTHSYLNMSPGLDFETKIIAKVNAAQKLREAFASRSYEPLMLNLGSATDAYQPIERKLGITRAVIEVMSECSHPFSVVTKSSGIERDLDLIAPMAAKGLVAAYVSITSLDANLSRILEPRAAADVVDGFIPGCLDDPSAWELRHPGGTPPVDGDCKGFLRRLFGEVEIAHQPDERRDDSAPVGAIDRINCRVGIHEAPPMIENV